jgi:CheY-like chemotaxis protein
VGKFPSHAKRILLVEDDPQVVRMRDVLAMRLGLPVEMARTVDKAIELLAKATFGLVIIDIMMTPGDFGDERPVHPLEAGFRLAVRLQEGTVPRCKTPKTVPILIYTAVASAALIAQCRTRFTEQNVFCKPCEVEKLVQRAREIFAKRALLIGRQVDEDLHRRVANSTPYVECKRANCVDHAVRENQGGEFAVALLLDSPSASEKKKVQDAFPKCTIIVSAQVDVDAVRRMAACV